MSTLMPARTAVTASVAATVVLPTPPLPATISTRDAEQNCSSSIGPCYGSSPAVLPERQPPKAMRRSTMLRLAGVLVVAVALALLVAPHPASAQTATTTAPGADAPDRCTRE